MSIKQVISKRGGKKHIIKNSEYGMLIL